MNTELELLIDEVTSAMSAYKPDNWRDGQFVFNYIDCKYGVARAVQFVKRIDCFYNDDRIDAFIASCAEVMAEQNIKVSPDEDVSMMFK